MPTLNATLFVSSFNPTGNPGEYTFIDAKYVTQYDPFLQGTSAVVPGFILFIPATSVNSGFIIPGVVHRYLVTHCSPSSVEPFLNGTVLWDEPGVEQDIPTNGVHCLLSQPTEHLGVGLPPSEEIYPALASGTSWGSLLTDIKNIVDLIQQTQNQTSSFSATFSSSDFVSIGNGESQVTLTHGLTLVDSKLPQVSVYENVDGNLTRVDAYTKVTATQVLLVVSSHTIFSGQIDLLYV